MARRGRPKTADVLTPREWEVLALLRDGLSNRQIGERLGISYDGARFHVSEILSKLGVASREEAADWQPSTSPRWALAPFALFACVRDAVAGLGAPKLAAGALVLSLALGGVAVSAFGVDRAPGGQTFPVSSAPSPTPDPDNPCQPPNCVSVPILPVASIDEIAARASFQPLLPAYIPDGYEPEGLVYIDARPPGVARGDHFTAYYVDGAGNRLIISQGYPAEYHGLSSSELVPEEATGSIEINGQRGAWVQGLIDGSADWVNGELVQRYPSRWALTGPLSLSWEMSPGVGWEISPSGERRTGLGGVSYSVASYSPAGEQLPLDELIKIAESVQP